ncbi:MAG: LysM peptidoglycan-binding domain-containing protein [Planctomycetota bacterium]|jgi:nucleoid-associated protein YgaU
MTSDAKVGVLLGFVFIFIVAFLINGLGDVDSDQDNNELTENMVRSNSRSLGLGSSERKVSREVIEAIEPLPDVEKIWQESMADAEEVRYSAPLPVILPEKKEFETVQAGPLKQDVMKIEVPATVVKAEPEKDVPIKVMQITPPKQRIHVVKSGDNLASIAKEVYGDEEGNRMVTIERIFEANREQLESPDEIYEGQKLLIPSLLDVGSKEKEPSSVLSEVLVEVVKSIGRHPEETDVSKTPKARERWYEVKEDDSLWKIATQELGDGNRYKEIKRLNSDLLSDEDDLDIGLRLKLPLR